MGVGVLGAGVLGVGGVRMCGMGWGMACLAGLHQSTQRRSIAVVGDLEDQLRTDSVARHGEERRRLLRCHRSDEV